MGKSIQVSGSIAFDTILQFQGNFKENLVYDSNAALSLSFFCLALNPSEHQPSGTCNFSRIDRAEITFTGFDTVNDTIYMFAVNYNVFKIVSGMGGLTYSN